jgi:sec-independent protein translocase protein TatA
MNSIPVVLAWSPGLPELILILVIVLLLFGAKKLPDLARGIGQSIKEFKKASKEDESETKPAPKPGEEKKTNNQ